MELDVVCPTFFTIIQPIWISTSYMLLLEIQIPDEFITRAKLLRLLCELSYSVGRPSPTWSLHSTQVGDVFLQLVYCCMSFLKFVVSVGNLAIELLYLFFNSLLRSFARVLYWTMAERSSSKASCSDWSCSSIDSNSDSVILSLGCVFPSWGKGLFGEKNGRGGRRVCRTIKLHVFT